MDHCLKCGASRIIKYGRSKEGDQRYQCKECKRVLKDCHSKKRARKSAKPEEMKALAILLYAVGAMSLRAIAKILKVHNASVLRWIKNFAKTLAKPEIPSPPDGCLIVIDEMWHFVNGKPNKLWIWKAYDLATRKTFAWKLGRRDAATLKEFLDEIGIDGRDFVTDDYEAYHHLIPEYHLFTGKDLTFPIEQDNSNTRHYVGRFRRRCKITSRSVEMVDLSLLLLYHVHHDGWFEKLLDSFHQLF